MDFSGDGSRCDPDKRRDPVSGRDPGRRKAVVEAFTDYSVQACLYDSRRVEYLHDAIVKTVRRGDVVVDAGSGTGLLGLLAARAGARRVYCVELNSGFIPVIEENARRNGLGDRIVAVHDDAARYHPPEGVDVVVSEVISAGFFYEPQVQIINNLRRFLRPGGRIVPALMNNYVELISAQEDLYGLKFNFDSRFADLENDRPLSDAARYHVAEFGADIDPVISETVRVRASASGTANAVRITYDIEFAPGVWADKPTDFLLNPQIIFLAKPVPLRAGERYDVRLRYEASDLPRMCEIEVAAAIETERPAG